MKKTLLVVLLVAAVFNLTTAQVKYENFESAKLNETRQIKIQLPRGYEANNDKRYPVFIVLDGDYLFEAVAGNVDYFSYWEDMPESIVVGINQIDSRYDDCLYSEQNSLPIETGVAFFEFLGTELLPHIESKYRTTNFRVAVGHGETANFINYYLLKPSPLFQGYISVSPQLAPGMLKYLPERLSNIDFAKLFYALYNAQYDDASVKQMTDALNADIKVFGNNDKLVYTYKTIENGSHYSAPASAIPDALQTIFKAFQPISKTEYKDIILKLDGSPVAYLTEKYDVIKLVYGLDKTILINDFKAIEAAIEKNQRFEDYEALSKLAKKHYPDTILGMYYIARFYEETGEPKKAMRTYQSAYMMEEMGGITKDIVLEKAEAIKQDFGF